MKEDKIILVETPVQKKDGSFPSTITQLMGQCTYINCYDGDTLNTMDLDNPQLKVPIDPGDIRNDFIERKMGKSNKRR